LPTAAQSVDLPPGASREIELVAPAVSANVSLTTSDGQGKVLVDGHVVGDGAFHGTVPPGPHVFRVTRDGSPPVEPYEKRVVLSSGQAFEELVTLVPREPPAAPSRQERTAGPYGGVALSLLFQPDGTHNDICSTSGITHCSTSPPFGGGVNVRVGYAVDPLGIEAFLGFQVDGASVQGTVQGVSATLTIPRIGGQFALRARFALTTPQLRWTLAAGLGAAFRELAFLSLTGVDSQTYLAPAVSLETTVHARFSPTLAFSLGLSMWAENGGDIALQAKPLTVPVNVIRSTQLMILPLVGIEFGP
jgi:hypothetical protein